MENTINLEAKLAYLKDANEAGVKDLDTLIELAENPVIDEEIEEYEDILEEY